MDTTTCETRVDDFVALQEVGRVIHPVLAAGQIEGGVAQAIGYALYEDVVWRDGRMANAQMTNYIMPTSMDLPPIRVFFEERPYAHGPGGAKGIGELPMDGVAPAIANADRARHGRARHSQSRSRRKSLMDSDRAGGARGPLRCLRPHRVDDPVHGQRPRGGTWRPSDGAAARRAARASCISPARRKAAAKASAARVRCS